MGLGLPVKVRHGGTIKQYVEKTGLNPVDFSASLNPFPPLMEWDFPPTLLNHYPDDDYHQFKGNHWPAVSPGCGRNRSRKWVNRINTFILQVVFRNQGAAKIDTPTFGEYLLSVQLAGGHQAREGEIPSVAFLCNPNNPTGHITRKKDVSNPSQIVC